MSATGCSWDSRRCRCQGPQTAWSFGCGINWLGTSAGMATLQVCWCRCRASSMSSIAYLPRPSKVARSAIYQIVQPYSLRPSQLGRCMAAHPSALFGNRSPIETRRHENTAHAHCTSKSSTQGSTATTDIFAHRIYSCSTFIFCTPISQSINWHNRISFVLRPATCNFLIFMST